MTVTLLRPDWPAPGQVHALTTTRRGGISRAPFDSLNLALHVGDQPQAVFHNRQAVIEAASLPETPRWLHQVHGTTVIASDHWSENCRADAIFSQHPHHVCPVLTADCLPVLLCDQTGSQVAAIHAGWRGLVAGIIEQTLALFNRKTGDIMAWLGPAIGPRHFEVGKEVMTAFIEQSAEAEKAFIATANDHFLADLYLLARQRLYAHGVTAVYGGRACTYADKANFFSYRRDHTTGRMASMIWINAE